MVVGRKMVKELGAGAQNLPADVTQLIDQLERHCLAPDGSLISKSTYYDLQLVLSTSLEFPHPLPLKNSKEFCIFIDVLGYDDAGQGGDDERATALFGSVGSRSTIFSKF